MKIQLIFSLLLVWKEGKFGDATPTIPETLEPGSENIFWTTFQRIKNGLRGGLRCLPNPPPIDACIGLPTNNITWTQYGKDIDGTVEDGNAGLSVSMAANGTRVAIGEDGGLRLYDSYLVLSSGFIDWTSGGNLGSFFDHYVVSVALSADGLKLIAGEQQNFGKVHSGSVRIFKYVDEVVYWVQSGNTLRGSSSDEFGRSVDISDDGTIIAIGAPGGKYASVYGLEDLTWTLTFTRSSGNFGRSVALASDGKMVAMGTPSTDHLSTGSVFVYEVGSNDLINKFDGDINGDQFGYSTSFSDEGSRLVIGAPGADYVRIYDFDVSSSKFDETPVVLRSPVNNTQYGHSVSVSGDAATVAVGAPAYDSTEQDIGKAYVYLVNNCGDSKLIGSIVGESATDAFGYSLALSGNGTYLASGAINNEGVFSGVDGDFNGGHVRVYKGT